MNILRVLTASILFAVAALGGTARADMIILADGTTLQVFNVDVTPKCIYYTESEAADAPVLRIAADKVFAYKIGDGPMQKMGAAAGAPQATAPASPAPAEPATGEIAPVPSADNATLIARYNNHPPLQYLGKEPEPDKFTSYFLSLWGMEENSVVSDSVLEIGFEHVFLGDKEQSIGGERLKVTNKTNKTVYISLAYSFRKMNGGYMDPFFKNAVYSEGTTSGRGGSVNLGAVTGALGLGGALGTLASGINLGGGVSQSAGVTTAEQEVLVVPPHSSVIMPGRKISNGKKILECYEPLYFKQKKYPRNILSGSHMPYVSCLADQEAQRVPDDQLATRETLNVRRWVQTDFTPENSPKKVGWLITYSTSPDFAAYTSLPVNMFMRGAFGMNWNSPILGYYNSKTYTPDENYDYMIVGVGEVKK